jgi:hypothetical protein
VIRRLVIAIRSRQKYKLAVEIEPLRSVLSTGIGLPPEHMAEAAISNFQSPLTREHREALIRDYEQAHVIHMFNGMGVRLESLYPLTWSPSEYFDLVSTNFC